ncbi:helix-turn-helix transcriptional regulator [Comamonas testosteroni]|uniref:helix-turn-helix domain-containing protein n=1 Tax=Comamonas testosteroni TaxID=285 RepID=UPI001F493A6A|nr:helix-turn-helix transcriptional regulator [Comamonas testosteroni]WQG69601.1 helix-turn-helix transcriptional regulator [Comamonas testosteroni]
MGISARIQEERKRLGLTQEAAAEKMGATKRSVINWEGGASLPGAEALAQFSLAGADVLYVLTGERGGRPAESGHSDETVRQAVVDAVDLLSLDDSVNASQLAKAVVKLCSKAPALAQQPTTQYFEGSQQNIHGTVHQNFGHDLVITQPEKPRKK